MRPCTACGARGTGERCGSDVLAPGVSRPPFRLEEPEGALTLSAPAVATKQLSERESSRVKSPAKTHPRINDVRLAPGDCNVDAIRSAGKE